MTTSSIASFVFTATQLTQNNKNDKKMQNNFSRKHFTHSKQISKVTATIKCSDIVKEVDFKDADQSVKAPSSRDHHTRSSSCRSRS